MNQQRKEDLRGRFYPRVNTRITAPFLLITIIVAGLGVFIVTRLVTTTIDERLNNQLLNSAQATKNAMVALENEQLAALRSMVFTEGVPRAIIEDDSDLLSTLLDPIVTNSLIDTVVIYDVEGNLLYSARFDSFALQLIQNPASEYLSLESVRRALIGDIDSVGDKFVEVNPNSDGTYQLYFAAPVVLENDITVGAIAIGIHSSRILRRLTEQSLAGITVYASDGTMLGNSLLNSNAENLALSPAELSAFSEPDDEFSTIREITVGGNPYRTLYTSFEVRSQNIGILAVSLRTDFVISQLSVSRNVLVGLFGGLFFVVAVIGITVTRSIVQPITHLVDTTRAISEGDLTRRTGLELPDELGELSQSFDKMTDSLVARNQEIEGLYHEQVQETTRRDAILSSISDAVIVRSANDEILLANPAARQLIENVQPYEEVYQQFYYLQSNPGLLSEPRSVSLLDKHYSVLATPVITQSNQVLGYIVVFRDITQMVEAERLKDEMILQLSHELRTPLSSVRGYVELTHMLNQDSMDAQSEDFLFKSIGQIHILERMVNQVIDVSAILADDMRLEIVNVDFTGIVRDVMNAYYPQVDEKDQIIDYNFPDNDVIIEGDVQQLRDVVDHLISNAMNYTPETGWIDLTIEEINDSVILYVVDNGVGIHEDEIDLVFDRMYRGRSADAGETDTRGLGLGLYISREIIKAHHGSISISSQPRTGTIVTVILPLRQPERLNT